MHPLDSGILLLYTLLTLLFNFSIILYSSLLTCTCDTPKMSAISFCVISLKYLSIIIFRSLGHKDCISLYIKNRSISLSRLLSSSLSIMHMFLLESSSLITENKDNGFLLLSIANTTSCGEMPK